MKVTHRRPRLPGRTALGLLLAPFLAGLSTLRADLLPDLDLGGATLSPAFAPEIAAYATSLPPLRGGLALYPRIGSAGQTLHLRDAEGRFRRVSPGATLAAGRQHFIALRENGTAVAWGSNSNGVTTVPAAALSGVVAVAAGHYFNLVLKTDGSVVVWGRDADDSGSPLAVPVAAQSGIIAIAGGADHALALRTDGSVVAWGANYSGQSTVPVLALSDVVAIAAGANHSLALKADGSVVAWGSIPPVPVGAQSGVVAIAAHVGYSVALKADGSLVCWGVPPSQGFPAADVGPVVGVAAAQQHLATLRADGSVQVWTSNNYPTLLAIPDTARGAAALAMAEYVAAALLPDGRVVTWGVGGDPALTVPAGVGRMRLPASARLALQTGATSLEMRLAAAGDLALSRVPLLATSTVSVVLTPDGVPSVYDGALPLPASATGLVAIKPGIGLKADGAILAWSTSSGLEETVPHAVATEPAVAIESVGSTRFALSSTGVLRGWTAGAASLLILPSTAQSGVVGFAGGFAVTGASHSLALKIDGSVVAWGDSSYGKTTVPAAALSGVVAVAAGSNHSVALRADRTLVLWGRDYTDTGAPAYEYPLPKPVAKIAAGDRVTAVLYTDGELSLFGFTHPGAGNLMTSQPLAARSGVADFALYQGNALALTSDGTLIAWRSFSSTTHATGLSTLRAGPSGDAVTLLASRAAPSPALATLKSSAGGFTPALAPDSLHLAQTVPSATRGVTLAARGEQALMDFEASINGGPSRRFIGGASLAGGNAFNLGITPQGKTIAWGSSSVVTNLPTDPGKVVSVAAGNNHALVLRADGSLRTWGSSSTATVLHIPAAARYDVVAIAAAGDNSAALRRGGTPVFWGNNSNFSNVPSAASSGVAAIALGHTHALALKTDGSVVGWGSSYATPPSPATSGVVAIAAGQDFSLALKTDGSVVAWGTTSYGLGTVPGQIGARAVAIAASRTRAAVLLNDGSVVTWGDTSAATPSGAFFSDVIALSGGHDHIAALKSDGSVVPWGYFPTYAEHADIRLAPPTRARLPLRSGANVISLRSIAADGAPLAATPLVAGRERNWFLLADGRMDSGIVNLTTSYPTPPAAADLVNVAAVASGGYGEYAVRFDGTVRTLRGGTSPVDLTTTSTTSGQIRPRALRVAVADYFAVALLEDRKLRIWGSTTTLPGALSGDMSAVSAGRLHVIALRTDGRPVIWGTATGATATVPAAVQSGVLAVAAGEYFNLALKLDGTLAAWGENSGVTSAVPAGNDFVAIAAGDRHAVALRADGSAVAWGENFSGQTTVPALAQADVVALAAAASHTLALRADGRVVAWGNNAFSPGYAGYLPGARHDYRLAVERTLADPGLVSLATGAGPLSPEFSPATTAYTQTVPANTSALTLHARSAEPGQLQGRVNGRPFARLTRGPGIAAEQNFVVGINPDGGAVFLTYASPNLSTIPAAAQSDLVAIAAGAYHVLALRADGTPVAWGDASTNVKTIPGAATRDVIAIAARRDNSLALRSDGQVVGWGNNGTLASVPSNLGTDNQAIALGVNHALVLKTDGRVVQWGSSPALPAATQADVVAIAAGEEFSLALKRDGTVVAWGFRATMLALPVAAQSGVASISAGRTQALAIRTDGTPVFWDSGANSSLTMLPSFPNNVVDFAGSQSVGAALLADGRVSLWGSYSALSPMRRPVALPLSAPITLREGTNRLDLRVTPAGGRLLHEAGFATGIGHHLTVTASGSVQISRNAAGASAPPSGMTTYAQSGVAGVYARGSRLLALRHDGGVVPILDGGIPTELQPTYTAPSGPQAIAPARAVSLALGSSETLTLRADGTVFAWQNDSAVPAAARSGVASIAASPGSHFLAVRTDGRLVKWNVSGVDNTLPAATQSGVLAAASTDAHCLVLKIDGSLVAWRHGNLAASDALTTIPEGATDIVAIAAANQHFLALRRDGRVFSWGSESTLNPVPDDALSGIVAIAAGPSHAVALRENGSFVTWGRSAYGALLPPDSDGLIPEPIRTYSLTVDRALLPPGLDTLRVSGGEVSPAFASATLDYTLPATPWRSLAFTTRPRLPLSPAELRINDAPFAARSPGASTAVTDYAVLTLRPDGTLQIFGSGPVTFQPLPDLSNIAAVAAGREHALVLRRDGRLHAWGSTQYQQTAAPVGDDFVAVAAGDNHSLALTTSGGVVAWGSNNSHQTRVPAAARSDVVAIAAGEQTSIALKADGTVVAWGRNHSTPQTIPADAQSGIVAVSAGRQHFVALRADGRVVEWGGQVNPSTAPTHGIVAIASGGDHNLALRANGEVVQWSSGYAESPYTLPSALPTDLASFALGRRLGALLRADGSLRVISNSGNSLTQANNTPAYAGPYALPLSARVPLDLGANTVQLRFSRPDAALPATTYSFAVERQPAPEYRVVVGLDPTQPAATNQWLGTLVVGGSASVTFTLQNRGTADLVLSDADFGGDDGIAFQLGNLTPPLTVPPGGTHTFTITATPHKSGMLTAPFLPVLNLPGAELPGLSVSTQGYDVASETAAWRASYFTTEELADPALETTLWGHQADPDGDSLANLLEYALGLSPRTSDPSPVVLATETDPERGPILSFTYTRFRRAASAGLLFRVVASHTLEAGSWSALEVEEQLIATDGMIETIRATVPVAAPGRFLRLEVTAP